MEMVPMESAPLAALSHRPNQPGRKHLTRTASITTYFKRRTKPTLSLAGVPQGFAGYRLVIDFQQKCLFNWLLPRELLFCCLRQQKRSSLGSNQKLLRTAAGSEEVYIDGRTYRLREHLYSPGHVGACLETSQPGFPDEYFQHPQGVQRLWIWDVECWAAYHGCCLSGTLLVGISLLPAGKTGSTGDACARA